MTDVITTKAIDVFVLGDECDRIVVESDDYAVVESVEQGLPGPPGPIGPAGGIAVSRNTDGPLSALLIVWEDTDGTVRPLDRSDGDHIDLLCGLTLTATGSAGMVNVQRSGTVDDSSWSWTPGRVYLGANGTLTQTPPVDGFSVLVGVAVSPTRLILNVQDPIELE